mmetsp:Transcript_13116/g.24629  ORF Transcript_13116/g.24629 Transcript_13116/m.24629 type:complete len:114 (-) Transcript_13116:251-592(-)
MPSSSPDKSTDRSNSSSNNQQADADYDNSFAMLVMAGMVASAAGFSMYTRHAGSLLRQMNKVSQMQQGGGRVVSKRTPTAASNGRAASTKTSATGIASENSKKKLDPKNDDIF